MGADWLHPSIQVSYKRRLDSGGGYHQAVEAICGGGCVWLMGSELEMLFGGMIPRKDKGIAVRLEISGFGVNEIPSSGSV